MKKTVFLLHILKLILIFLIIYLILNKKIYKKNFLLNSTKITSNRDDNIYSLVQKKSNSYLIFNNSHLFPDFTPNKNSFRYLHIPDERNNYKNLQFRLDLTDYNLFLEETASGDSVITSTLLTEFKELRNFINRGLYQHGLFFDSLFIDPFFKKNEIRQKNGHYRINLKSKDYERISKYPFKDNQDKQIIYELLVNNPDNQGIFIKFTPRDILKIIYNLSLKTKVTKANLLIFKDIKILKNHRILIAFNSPLLKQSYLLLYNYQKKQISWFKKYQKLIDNISFNDKKERIYLGFSSATYKISSEYFNDFFDNGNNLIAEFLILNYMGKVWKQAKNENFDYKGNSVAKIFLANMNSPITSYISYDKNISSIFLLDSTEKKINFKGIVLNICTTGKREILFVQDENNLKIYKLVYKDRLKTSLIKTIPAFSENYSLPEAPILNLPYGDFFYCNPFTIYSLDNTEEALVSEDFFVKEHFSIGNKLLLSTLQYNQDLGYQQNIFRAIITASTKTNYNLLIQIFLLLVIFLAVCFFEKHHTYHKNSDLKDNFIHLFVILDSVYFYTINSRLVFKEFSRKGFCFNLNTFFKKLDNYGLNYGLKENKQETFTRFEEYSIINSAEMEIFTRASHDLKNHLLNLRLNSGNHKDILESVTYKTILLSRFSLYLNKVREKINLVNLLESISDELIFQRNYENLRFQFNVKEFNIVAEQKLLNQILKRLLTDFLSINVCLDLIVSKNKLQIEITSKDADFLYFNKWKSTLNILDYILADNRIVKELHLTKQSIICNLKGPSFEKENITD